MLRVWLSTSGHPAFCRAVSAPYPRRWTTLAVYTARRYRGSKRRAPATVVVRRHDVRKAVVVHCYVKPRRCPVCWDLYEPTSHWVWRSTGPDALRADVRTAGKVTSGGWTLEVAIPVAALHGYLPTIAPGQQLGFNLSVVDIDTDGAWNHLTWSGSKHDAPKFFGTLFLR